MPDLSSLHCPNCGAPAAPTATQCPYCQARLATMACPSCFELMFEGTNYCPHCGAQRDRHAAEGAAARCPGCLGTLQPAAVGATTLLDCSTCGGVWMDADAFERLCADREAQAAVLHRIVEAQSAPAAAVHYRPCVRCGKLMNRINFGKGSGVIVDVCRGHGTFLDRGELHQIVTFIQAGGLDRMREHQLQDIADEERRLRALQTSEPPFANPEGWEDHSFQEFIRALFKKYD